MTTMAQVIAYLATPHCVYGLIEDGEIVYVGCTKNPVGRLKQHKSVKKVSKAATLREIRWYSTPLMAWRYERFYIRKLKPRLNKNMLGPRSTATSVIR